VIDLRRVIDLKSPHFLIAGGVAVVMVVGVVPVLLPGDAYHYDIKAHWTEDNTGTLLVTGDLTIRRPCPGSRVSTVYETADKLADPLPAVRVGHIEEAMVGQSTVIMIVDKAKTVPVAITFKPPPEALGIRWLMAPSREACPEEAKRNPFEVGYVQIPPRRP
jgi:hypothetical protein